LYRKYTIDPDQNKMVIAWTRVSSDFLKTIEGSWEIFDTPDKGVYLLVYRSFVDAYIPVSRSIQKGALKEAENMAAKVRAWIEYGK
jgi:hypothetical protein